jgi:tetratricopeptide (TPR) repeat protein
MSGIAINKINKTETYLMETALGLIYEKRGDIEKAREYWEKALGLFKHIGMPHKVEYVEGLLEGIKDK